MNAQIVGIRETEFTDRDNKPQHYIKYHLVVETGESGLDGREALTASINVMQDGRPSEPHKVGDKVNVSYRKNNKIVIDGKAG